MEFANDLQRALWLAVNGRISWEDVYLFHASDRVARERDRKVHHAWHKHLAKRRAEREGVQVSKRKRVAADTMVKHHAPNRALALLVILTLVRAGGEMPIDELNELLTPILEKPFTVSRLYHMRGVNAKKSRGAFLRSNYKRVLRELMDDEFVIEFIEENEAFGKLFDELAWVLGSE